MSQASSSSSSGGIVFGTNEETRPVNWPLIVGFVVAGLAAFLWLRKK